MIKKCLCGKEFITYPSKILLGRGKYCSRTCSDSALTHQTPWNKGIKMPQISGSKHGRWKGWRYCGRNNNYREIRIDGNYIREHRLVMEEFLGRKLTHTEEVHHLDGNGLNNDINNLVILNKSEHLKLEHKNGKYKSHLAKIHQTHSISTETIRRMV